MPADVIMPALGMAQETGKVVRWLKQDGELVAKGEPLLEVETDKVTVEIEAPADGTLGGVRVPEGAAVPVGTVIAVVLAAGEVATDPHPEPLEGEVEAVAAAPPSSAASPERPRRRLASPKARRLAEEQGVDLDTLAGSGPNGAIVARDLEALHRVVTGNGDEDFAVGSVRRREIADAARSGRLRPEDVQDGTFTISNLGMFGVDSFQAIVNSPQAAILAVGRIVERPWAADGAVVVRPILTLTVAFDHRVVDGARGAEFLNTLAELIEEPTGLVA